MKKIFAICSAALICASALAQEPHFKPYGFARTYFAFDSRESTAGTDDLYYWMPKDSKMVGDVDLNATPSFRFAALTSRIGLDVLGYEVDGYKISAKFETDFYAGLTGVTGTAQLRLRQAYVSLAKHGRTWKVGQTWHPMAADLPDIISLESGAPFGPFSRTPQVQFDLELADGLNLTTAALWQMQYTSTGPEGASANYVKYGIIPELYAGLSVKFDNGSVVRIGGDMVSIKPRRVNDSGRVSDRLTTWNAFVYGNAKFDGFDLKSKLVYATDGSHFNLLGGYGVTAEDASGNRSYSPTRNVSGWTSLAYRKLGRWVPQMMVGYIQMFGTADRIIGESYVKNSASTVNRMFRVQPEIVYNLGKVGFALEYMATGAQFGKSNAYMLATDDLHWVVNHRVQMMVKYTF